MPSRKLADRCPRCGAKNHLRAKFCNECGCRLRENRAPKDGEGRAKLHADVAHPINAACRQRIQQAVIEAYEAERERAKSPDYQPPSFDDFDDYEEVDVGPASSQSAGDAPADDARDQDSEGEEGFSEYNALIADLRRDAADRRDKPRHKGHSAGGGLTRRSGPVDDARRDDRHDADTDTDEGVDTEEPAVEHEPVPAAKHAGDDSDSDAASSREDDDFGAGLI